MFDEERWLEERARARRQGEDTTYHAIPLDKYGPVRVTVPFAVKLICLGLLAIAAFNLSSTLHQWPIFHHGRPLPPGATRAFFSLQYLATAFFALVNAGLSLLLLLRARCARRVALVTLTVEFAAVLGVLLTKAFLVHQTIIPASKNPSLSALVLFLAVIGAALVIVLIFGSMIIALLDTDVVKAYEGDAGR